jgi:hypothetical protein
MRKQMVISVAAIIAIMAMVTPVFAQCGFGGLGGCGFGAPLGIGGCGFGAPLGIGGCGLGFVDPLSSIVGLGLSMITSVIGAAFSCIPLGGLGFGGCGIPFGGCGIPFGGCGFC